MTEHPGVQSQLATLRAQVAATREERLATQRAAGDRRAVELALAAVDRDRDAGSSPELEQLRDRGERLSAQLRSRWMDTDHRRILLARLKSTGLVPDYTPTLPPMDHSLTEESLWRSDANARLTAIGSTLQIPLVAQPDLPEHPNRQVIEQAAAEYADVLADREARMRKQRRDRKGEGPGGTR